MDRRLLLRPVMRDVETTLKPIEIRALDRVTGGANPENPAWSDPRAREALDAAVKQYGTDRVMPIANNAERLRDMRSNGYPITHGYVVGTDGKILKWIEGR